MNTNLADSKDSNMSLEELRAKARQKQKNALREGEREKEFRYKQKKSKTPLEVIGERPES